MKLRNRDVIIETTYEEFLALTKLLKYVTEIQDEVKRHHLSKRESDLIVNMCGVLCGHKERFE